GESKDKLKELTGLANPNSTTQMLGWLRGRGCPIESVGREVLEAELVREGADPLAREAINLRLAAAKSSVKKYVVAEAAAGDDGRLRGCFQFYGAATGRWAGRLMQLQNLPRGDLHGQQLDVAREIVREGDAESVEWLFGGIQDTLKSLIRTVLVPKPGYVFAVSDFSAIEARVLAALAGEQWLLDIFKTTGKVYEGTASRMFGVPIDAVDKELRQRGKVATLALGYQGGPAALERMGALAMGIPAKELPKMVRMWRNANKHIVELWAAAEEAARAALAGEGSTRIAKGAVQIRKAPAVGGMAIDLVSGRSLYYRGAKLDPCTGKLSYQSTGRAAGALTIDTYGGRLVENITQAVARDLLADAMVRLEAAGYEIVAHVHDEVIVEVPQEGARGHLDYINKIMGETPAWAGNLPLSAEGYTCSNYRKE
ncbi:MAG: DNA polymerase, partial [Gordonibacter sp.]